MTASKVPTTDAEPDVARRMSSEERREQIVDAAIAVFGAKGYVGTTTDDVARAASVSQPYVVRLFGTKENLFLAALDSSLERLMAAFRTAPNVAELHERRELMGQTYLGLLEVRGLHQTLSHAFLLGAHPVIGPPRAPASPACGDSSAKRPASAPTMRSSSWPRECSSTRWWASA